jgi:protein ImuB
VAGPVCCGLIPHLELALHPDLYGRPVVVAPPGGRVIAASREALDDGVFSGLTLSQAEALCPSAMVVESQPEAAGRLTERIAAALYDLAPSVEVRLDGRAWLDLAGVPGTGRVIREARARLRRAAGVEPRLGIAPGPFTACLAAVRSKPGRLLVVAEARPFLAPLSVAELPLEREQLERLDLLGLRTLGEVAAIGPRRLQSQLGRAGREAVLLARGDEPRELIPWRPPQVTGARRQLEPPVEDREALLFVAHGLAADLAAELGLRGAGAKRLRILLWVEGRGEPERRESVVRHPLSSVNELFGLAGAWLREWQPAAPVIELAMELPELEAAGRRQLRLWRGGDGSKEEVEAALERLQERYGDEVALGVHPELPGSPLPEQRYGLKPKR